MIKYERSNYESLKTLIHGLANDPWSTNAHYWCINEILYILACQDQEIESLKDQLAKKNVLGHQVNLGDPQHAHKNTNYTTLEQATEDFKRKFSFDESSYMESCEVDGNFIKVKVRCNIDRSEAPSEWNGFPIKYVPEELTRVEKPIKIASQELRLLLDENRNWISSIGIRPDRIVVFTKTKVSNRMKEDYKTYEGWPVEFKYFGSFAPLGGNPDE